MNKQKALDAIGEMQTLIDGFGTPNADALKAIKRHIFALRTDAGYLNEKLGSLETWANIGFSTRKYQRWGLDRVKHFALTDLMMVRQLVEHRPDEPAS